MSPQNDHAVPLDDAVSEPEPVVVGYVRRAHGIKGELLVHPQTDYPGEVFDVGRVFHITEGAPIGLQAELTLERARPHGGGWILAFQEIEDRTLAERYGGAHLAVDREHLLAPETGEYFLHDLVGLEVVLQDADRPLGRVEGIYDTPGRPILNVRDEEDEEVLVPFDRSVVSEVDLEEGILRISPPNGLLEL